MKTRTKETIKRDIQTIGKRFDKEHYYLGAYMIFEMPIEVVVNKEDDAMIHLRYATHGSKTKENCHPFEADGFIFAHNGVLPIESKNDMTDSEIYFHRLLPKLKKYGIDSPQVKKDVENIIGGSKFCIFDTQRQQVKLFGHYTEVNGCYFSNLNFV